MSKDNEVVSKKFRLSGNKVMHVLIANDDSTGSRNDITQDAEDFFRYLVRNDTTCPLFEERFNELWRGMFDENGKQISMTKKTPSLAEYERRIKNRDADF